MFVISSFHHMRRKGDGCLVGWIDFNSLDLSSEALSSYRGNPCYFKRQGPRHKWRASSVRYYFRPIPVRPLNKHERLISRLSPWRKATKHTNPRFQQDRSVEVLQRTENALSLGHPMTYPDLTLYCTLKDVRSLESPDILDDLEHRPKKFPEIATASSSLLGRCNHHHSHCYSHRKI